MATIILRYSIKYHLY